MGFYKPNHINLDHIFNIDVSIDHKGKTKISGFHLDPKNIIIESGIVEIEYEKIHPNGIREIKVKWLGAIKKSTIGPSTWSYHEYLDRVQEAMYNITSAEIDRKNQLKIKGILTDNTPFRIIIKEHGKIITAFIDFDIEKNADNNH